MGSSRGGSEDGEDSSGGESMVVTDDETEVVERVLTNRRQAGF